MHGIYIKTSTSQAINIVGGHGAKGVTGLYVQYTNIH